MAAVTSSSSSTSPTSSASPASSPSPTSPTSPTSTYTIIDADTHITEPPDVWVDRVPKKFRDQVFHVERRDDGEDIWVLDGQQVSMVGYTAAAGWPEPFPGHPKTYDECHPAAYDSKARLAYMDEIGIWSMVLYPNVAGFGAQKFLRLDDTELKLACVRAYNQWLRDWIDPDPRRFVTIMSIPFWDVEAAVAEVERGVEAGHRGVLFTGKPQASGLPILGDPHWDPLWSVCQETGMAVHFHIGSGDFATSFTPERTAVVGTAAAYAFTSVEMFMGNGVQVADLMLSGVLPRFPDLKFVSVESGIGWVPFLLEAVDHSYLEGRKDRKSQWDGLPSDYFREQVYTCYWFEQYAPLKMIADGVIPANRVLFETDFPHPTCLYDNVHEKIEAGLGAAPAEVRRQILWQNAVDLYRIETP